MGSTILGRNYFSAKASLASLIQVYLCNAPLGSSCRWWGKVSQL